MARMMPFRSLPERAARVGLIGFCTLVFAFLLLPILVIIPLSFNAGSYLFFPLSGFSLRWYREVFSSPEWTAALQNSLIVATATAIVSTLLGSVAALGLMRLTPRMSAPLVALLLSPLFVPVIVTAVAVYFLYAQLGLDGSYAGLILAHTTLAVPFVIVVVRAALQGFDTVMLRAGASLGARPPVVFARVLLPLIAPAIAAGAVFAFMTSFDETVVALFVAGPDHRTLPLQMFEGVRDQISPAITAVATLLVLASAVFLSFVEGLRRVREKKFNS